MKLLIFSFYKKSGRENEKSLKLEEELHSAIQNYENLNKKYNDDLKNLNIILTDKDIKIEKLENLIETLKLKKEELLIQFEKEIAKKNENIEIIKNVFICFIIIYYNTNLIKIFRMKNN